MLGVFNWYMIHNWKFRQTILFAVVVIVLALVLHQIRAAQSVLTYLSDHSATIDVQLDNLRGTLAEYRPLTSDERLVLFDETVGFTHRPPANMVIAGQDCLKNVVECSVNEIGLGNACNMCLQASAHCIHYNQPVYLHTVENNFNNSKQQQKSKNRDSESDEAAASKVLYPANSRPNKGYCTPLVVASTPNTSSGGGDLLPTVTLKRCNQSTARRVLAKLTENAIGYTFLCQCLDERVFTQRVPLMSDCDLPVVCEKRGGTTAGYDMNKLFSFDQLTCDNCPIGTRPDRDALTNLPTCVAKGFAEMTAAEFNLLVPPAPRSIGTLPVTSDAIDPSYASLFSHPNERTLYDPCSFDPITGKELQNWECSLTHTLVADKKDRIYFCTSHVLYLTTVLQSETYLRGNVDGRYPAACVRVIGPLASNVAEIVEYWNGGQWSGKENTESGRDYLDVNAVRRHMVVPAPLSGIVFTRPAYNSGIIGSGVAKAIRYLVDVMITHARVFYEWPTDKKKIDERVTGDNRIYGMHQMIRRTKFPVYIFQSQYEADNNDTYFVHNEYAAPEDVEYPAIVNFEELIENYNVVLVAYNARAPNDSSDLTIRTIPSNEFGDAGLPHIFMPAPLTPLGVPIPYIGANKMKNIPSCSQIGRYTMLEIEEPALGFPNYPVLDIITPLYTSFVTCSTSVDDRFDGLVVPNMLQTVGITGMDYKFSTSTLAFDSDGVAYAIWLGHRDHLSAYVEHLPAIPLENLY